MKRTQLHISLTRNGNRFFYAGILLSCLIYCSPFIASANLVEDLIERRSELHEKLEEVNDQLAELADNRSETVESLSEQRVSQSAITYGLDNSYTNSAVIRELQDKIRKDRLALKEVKAELTEKLSVIDEYKDMEISSAQTREKFEKRRKDFQEQNKELMQTAQDLQSTVKKLKDAEDEKAAAKGEDPVNEDDLEKLGKKIEKLRAEREKLKAAVVKRRNETQRIRMAMSREKSSFIATRQKMNSFAEEPELDESLPEEQKNKLVELQNRRRSLEGEIKNNLAEVQRLVEAEPKFQKLSEKVDASYDRVAEMREKMRELKSRKSDLSSKIWMLSRKIKEHEKNSPSDGLPEEGQKKVAK